MKLYLSGHGYRYALEQIQLALFPDEAMEYVEEPFAPGETGTVSALSRRGETLLAETAITHGGKTTRAALSMPASEQTPVLVRQLLRRCYYQAALPHLAQVPVWGALSGVRPSKLTTRHILQGGTFESADELLREIYAVSPDRRQLCLEATKASLEAMNRSQDRDLSVYVGIPFCPTRCAYCSFVSASIRREQGLLEPFFRGLLQEIRLTGPLMRASGWRVRSLYVGGGTPTTLSAEQLETLMAALREAFDLSGLLEYTVEAGRPDTLDLRKLRTLRAGGADRVSINPQTMEDAVLRLAARPHTAQDTVRAFREAREAGFSCVNMDLIAGLPGDTPEGFARSLDRVLALGPENVTVHTLALKKAADLYENRQGLLAAAQVADMLSGSGERLRRGGYGPYYLYRQKYMSGSFENIGWTLPGHTGWYNIYMMEELHPVLALGGGGVSKLVDRTTGRIQRFSNPKYPREYISRPDDIQSKKEAFFTALGQLPASQGDI